MYRIQYVKKQIQIKKGFFSNIEEFNKKINIQSFTEFYENYYGENPITTNHENGKDSYQGVKFFKNKGICPKGYIKDSNIYEVISDQNDYDFGFYEYKSCINGKSEQEEETITVLEDDQHVVETELGEGNYHRKTFYFGVGISKVSNGTIKDDDNQDYEIHNIYVFFLNKGRINMREYSNDIVQKYLNENLIGAEQQIQIFDESKLDNEKLDDHLGKLTSLTVTKEMGYTNNPNAKRELHVKLIITSKDTGILKPIFDGYKLYKGEGKANVSELPELYTIMEGGEMSASYEEEGHEKNIRSIKKTKEGDTEDFNLIGEVSKDIEYSAEEIEYDTFREKCINYILNDEND